MSLTAHLRQRALYWAPATSGEKTDRHGQPNFQDPVKIWCRWVPAQGNRIDPQGQTKTRNATVEVDRELAVGGYLKLGANPIAGSPIDDRECFEIWAFKSTPNVALTERVRIAEL